MLERNDGAPSFLTTASLGGGTGSGLGSCILTALRDAYPSNFIISLCAAGNSAGHVPCAALNSVLAGSVLQVCASPLLTEPVCMYSAA